MLARSALAAAAFYAVLALAMFAQGILPGRTLSSSDQLWSVAPWHASAPPVSRPFGANPEQFDAATQFEPFLAHNRETLPHIPLWNPHIMSGRPYLANAQSAVFSPFSVPSYVLPQRPAPAVAAALKLFVGAFGTFLLARALGVGFAGALLAGLVFGFGQSIVDWVRWPETGVRVLLPWVLLMVELVLRRPRALPVAGLAAVVGLQFLGGHPETNYYVGLVAVAFASLRLAELGRARAPVVRPALALAGGAALGTALAAIAIVPFVELLLHSSDLDLRKLFAGDRIDAEYLLGLALPTYWGRPTQTDLLTPTLMLNHAFYAGALPLMLALGALLRPSPRRVAVAALAVWSLATVVGLDPFFSITQALPGAVRTDRLQFVALFAIALLAGRGLDDLMAARQARALVLVGLGAALLCLPLAYVALADSPSLDQLGAALTLAWRFEVPAAALADATRADVIHLGALLQWLPVAAAGVALIALRTRRRIAAPAFAALAVALTTFDLFKLGMGVNPAITNAQANQPTTAAIGFLEQRRPARFAGTAEFGFPAMLHPLAANLSMRYGLYDARGYDYPIVDRYTSFWNANVNRVPPFPSFFQFHVPTPDERALRALRLLSVGYLVQDPRSPPLTAPDLQVAYEGPDARVYQVTGALPRAFVVDRQQPAAGAEAARAAVESPAFDGRTTAVTEEPIPGVPIGAARAHSGSGRIVRYEPERVVVSATAAHPSVLVLTDTWFPGWEAEVDGRQADISRVDYLLRGVRLPPGGHTVVFAYRPASFRVGLGLSVAAVVALLGLVAVGARRA